MSPIPLAYPAFLLERGGYDIPAVNGGDANGGDDDPTCGARRAPGEDGGLECGARRLGGRWDAVPVRAPPCCGKGPHRRRCADDGRGQVGWPGNGDRQDQRGVRQDGRRQLKRVDGGHPPGAGGGRVGAGHADGRHLVQWRGRGDGPREGGSSVAPCWRRYPEQGVVGGGESGDATAAGPASVQVNGVVGDGVPRVKLGGAVGRRSRWGPHHGGRPNTVAV